MRHVLATIAVLLIALAGFHYWNGQQAKAFEAASEQADSLAAEGDLNAAIDMLNETETQRMSPGIRGKVEAKRLRQRTQLLAQAEARFHQQLSAGQLAQAETTLASLEAYLPPDRVQEERQALDRRRQERQKLNTALPDFKAEVDEHWDDVADALASWNATIRNPLKKHRKQVEDLIWNASALSAHVEERAAAVKKLEGLQNDIAGWRKALLGAPKFSVIPLWPSQEKLQEKIDAAESERADAKAIRETRAKQISDTLKSWTMAEPDRVRSGDELRALHRIMVLPRWLAASEKNLEEKEAAEAQQKLLACLVGALEGLPDEPRLNAMSNSIQLPVEDPVGLSKAVRAALLGSADEPTSDE